MQHIKNVLIIGAGIGGQLLKKDIETNISSLKVIGFVDDENTKQSGVLGKITHLAEINKIYKVDEMIIAIPSADGNLVRKIILANRDNRIPIKIVPRSQKIIGLNQVRYRDVKNIELEDFIGIRFIKKDVQALHKFYKNKTVLITGGAGSIGSEIVRQLLDLRVEKVIVYDNSEYLVFNLDQNLKEKEIPKGKYQLIIGDILNKKKFELTVQYTKPDIIFHAAAYKHVYLMEENIDEAVRNNVLGTKIVLDTAQLYGIKNFVFISTDKVVNPKGIMGASKKLAEFYVNTSKNTKTVCNIVRFGNVINSHGSVLPLFERQIHEHGYVTITHKKIKRFFMSIREAAQLVITSAAQNAHGEIFILDMGELIRIYDIALCLIRSKNLIPGKDIHLKFIGLKKGEKLVEELFTDNERKNIVKTKIDNIFRLKSHEKCPIDMKRYIEYLEELISRKAHQDELRKYLKKAFPLLS